MTRVMIVADSGSVLANLSAAVASVPGAYIVRHGSGRVALDRLVSNLAPDLVLIGDLPTAENAIAHAAEFRRAAPQAAVVVLTSGANSRPLGADLRALAATAMPDDMDAATLGAALSELLAERGGTASAVAGAPAACSPRTSLHTRRRPRAARDRRESRVGAAA